METKTVENIKLLCAERGLTIAALERKLDFSNGSLAKSKAISADRLYAVARFFGVTMESIMFRGTDTPYNADNYIASIYNALNEDGRIELDNYADYLRTKDEYLEEVE